MADYQSLVECVAAEISFCEQMVDLLAKERKALAAFSYVDLSSCIQQRRLIEAEWRQVCKQRKAEMAAFGGANLSLGALAQAQPPQRRASVLKLAARLGALISNIKREQRINLALVRSSLFLVGDTLKLIRGGTEPCYDATAGLVEADAAGLARWRA